MNAHRLLELYDFDHKRFGLTLALVEAASGNAELATEILTNLATDNAVGHWYRQGRQALGLEPEPAKQPVPTILATRKHHFATSEVPLE